MRNILKTLLISNSYGTLDRHLTYSENNRSVRDYIYPIDNYYFESSQFIINFKTDRKKNIYV